MFNDPGFACYAIHKDSIEAFIDALAEEAEPNDHATQSRCAEMVGLNWALLDAEELDYIEREVARRWQSIH
jgi:hypothetical protein